MNKLVLHACLLVVVLPMTAGAAAAPPADSTILLHEKGQFGPEPQSQTLSYSVRAEAGVKLGVCVSGRVKTGKATFRIIGKDNKVLYEHTGDSRMMAGAILSPLAEPQTLAPRSRPRPPRASGNCSWSRCPNSPSTRSRSRPAR